MAAPDRTILLTGATSGLGRAVAGVLAKQNDRIILHGRNRKRLGEVVDELADMPAQIEIVEADSSDRQQVGQLATAVAEMTDQLDVLEQNAGGGKAATNPRELPHDRYDVRPALSYRPPFA